MHACSTAWYGSRKFKGQSILADFCRIYTHTHTQDSVSYVILLLCMKRCVGIESKLLRLELKPHETIYVQNHSG